MDLNLETLKREILAYLNASEFAVFHGNAGGLEDLPIVLWDVDRYPDYQMFLETARKAGAKLILFAADEFEAADLDELKDQLEDAAVSRDEEREFQSRLRELRAYEGAACSIELAFDVNSRFYVYELQTDWYNDFIGLEEEIAAHISENEMDDQDESLGGYYSKN